MTRYGRRAAAIGVLTALTVAGVAAHDGPPFPIVSDQVSGPYRLSIWTDPDATDDGTTGGQFWVTIERAADGAPPPAGTVARVSIRALDRPGSELTAPAEPVRGDLTNQFAALLMDHEGRFAVRVSVAGPLGPAAVDAEVDATYDLRPPAGLLVLYLMPFLLAGLLWGRLLLRRRTAARRGDVTRAASPRSSPPGSSSPPAS